MILEMRDITGTDSQTAHIAFPPGVTLDMVFDSDEKLKAVKRRVAWVSINGMKTDRWGETCPQKNDKVVVTYEPGDLGISAIFTIISTLFSVVRFIMGLFAAQPPHPKLKAATSAYTFEGLRNNFPPGDPVPVIYGEHDTGGQVLMYYVDVVDKKHEKFYELIAVSEGDIEDVKTIRINGTDINVINAESGTIAWDKRLGGTSQSIITGFETIKNTFFDGRDLTPEGELKNGVPSSKTQLVYSTVSNDVEEADIHMLFPDGIGKQGLGKVKKRTITYEVYFSDQDRNAWNLAGTKNVTDKSRGTIIDLFHVRLPRPGAYDFRVDWVRADRPLKPGRDLYRTVLQNVTEYRGPSGPFSGVALVAAQGVANKKVQGGQPTILSRVRGRRVKVYSTTTSFVVQWTQNPAWCMRDYMTNSVYGMGPYVTEADLDLQSFLDFATICNSQVTVCDPLPTSRCVHSELGDAITDEPRMYGEFGGTAAPFGPPGGIETWRMISTHNSVANAGLIYCRVCCPHGHLNPNTTGANTPDQHCDAPEIWAEWKESSGSPVTGLLTFAFSDSTYQKYTGYAVMHDQQAARVSLHRYNSESILTSGTVLATVPVSLNKGTIFDVFVFANEMAGIGSKFIASSGHLISVTLTNSWGSAVSTEIIRTRDALPQNGGIDHIPVGNVGLITRPVSSGEHHSALWSGFGHVCGLCLVSNLHVDWTCDGEGSLEDTVYN